MKKIVKGVEPPKLLSYHQHFPANDWEQFRRNNRQNGRYTEVKDHLITDQGGLCAYCEIDLKQAVQSGDKDDFRVEHFHPKSDNSSGHNWNLDWNNLLGCCHGGSERDVIDGTSTNRSSRYTSPDHSCDVPKGGQNWDNIILNPLALPALPLLFEFARSNGAISTHQHNCTEANVDQQKAQNSIDYLRLDSPRLRRLRREALDTINLNLQSKIQSGMTLDEARSDIARRMLRKNAAGHWPAFFSAIRSYLGQAAEEQLDSIGYQG